jgi:MYXO-CTERM domain-containing protein
LNEVLAGTATANIAIRLRFNLSPGDSAGFTSVFNVIPEPSTAVLAGFGLLGLLAAGRRRKASR